MKTTNALVNSIGISSSNYICQSGKRFDLLKFILASFVVGIHAMPVTFCLRPLFRIAVPLFFMMSSYFFFLKQTRLLSNAEKKKSLITYINRVVSLYLFWTFLLLPFIIHNHEWYHLNIETILKIIKSFFISGTFPASWYLTALVISISLVWFLSKKMSNYVLLCLGTVAYIICCLTSNYFSWYEELPGSVLLYKSYSFVFGKPCNSFLSAVLYVVIGKVLAEKNIYVSNKKLLFIFAFSIILLFFEAFLIRQYRLNLSRIDYSDDSFFLLVPLCVSIFMLVGQNLCPLHINTIFFRNSSTIIYCCHFTIVILLCDYLNLFSKGYLLYLIAFMMAFVISLVLFVGEKQSPLKWLRYSH